MCLARMFDKVIKMKLTNLALSISVGLSASLLPNVGVANPDINTAQIINGQVSFSKPNANTLQINNSHGAIINWQDFSINAGELTHFQQSGANSAVLNNVTGGSISNIFGSLTSNGQVYLINPAGIVFGQNSIVNTAGFIASTLNLSNQDFLQGKLNFEGVDAGDILNQGFITAGVNGDIALIAPNITNDGVISVEQGDVILAAGEKVTLASLDAVAVGFEVQAEENSVTNLGSVTSDGGAIAMFAGTLQHEGVIEANTLSLDENGNVTLVAKNNLTVSESASITANGDDGGRVVIQNENGTTWVAGTVEANGENGQGGVVDVLGHQVGLVDDATITADGKTGGGEIHVGGNYQGDGLLQNASGTYVGENVSLSANAIETGDGGEVIVWADGATRFHGSISATGGELSGDGGFVETSGKQYLDVTGIKLDLLANYGRNGEWLLDPFNLTIGSGGDLFVAGGPNFESTNSGSNLNVDTLLGFLNAGTNVTINTGTIGGELGDITVATPIAVTGAVPVSLTMQAENNIDVNFSITSANAALNLTLNADDNYNLGADGIGQVNVNALINTNGGNVVFNAGDGINFSEFGDVTTGLGTLTLFTAANDISLGSFSVDAADLTSSADIIIDAGGALVMNNGGLVSTISSGNNNISIVANDVVLNGSINAGTGNLLISSDAGLDMDIGSFVAAGFVLDATEYGTLSAGNVFLGQSGIGDVYFNTAIDVTTPITVEGGNINFSHGTGTALNANGDVTLIAAGSIVDNSPGFLDVAAPNIDLTAGFGIGAGNPIEIQLSSTPGLFSFNNASGDVQIINTALLTNDVMRVTGDNTGVGGVVIIENDFGITDVSGTGVTSNAGLLELTGLQINVNSVLDNNNYSAPVAMRLLGDEIEISSNIFSTSGGLQLSNLNLGGIINFDTTSNATGDLDFAQLEIDFINALSIDFGTVADTSDMIFAAPMNFGATDVSFNAGADIQFSQGAVTAITTTGNVMLDSGANIVGQAISAVDIVANQLDFLSANGFGDTGTNAIEVNVGLLAGNNAGGSIFIDSFGPLTTGIINSSSNLPVMIEANGDLIVATITTADGSVILDTTAVTNGVGGSIFDDGTASPNISGAYRAELYSENGVGTFADNFELSNINDGDIAGGGLFTSVGSSGDIFIDNVGGAGSTFDIQAVTTGAFGEVFIHNATQQMNLNASIVTASGDITLESNSAINLVASLNAGGGSDVNVTLISGSGDVTINGGALSSNAVNITNNVAGITFGSTGFVLSPTVNLSANGIIDDSAATSSIGNGSQIAFLNAVATGNINLISAGNDADVVYLQSNTGNVTYQDVNDINLDQALATGSVSISSGGEIFDNNGLTTNITADSASIAAVNGIGVIDGIETSLVTALDFTNSTDGSVHFSDQSVNNLQVFGTNSSGSILDFTLIQSQNGSLTVPVGQALTSLSTDIILDVVTPGQSLTIDGTVSVSNANSQINLLSPFLNVSGTGTVLATGAALNLSVLLLADDMDLLGTLNGGVGDLAIENFTDGNTISIGGAVGDMNLSAADLASLTAGRIGIGQNGGSGNDAGSISVDGAVTFTVDTKLASVGDISFNQGAANGITSAANVELNTEGAIIDLSAGGYDVAANGLAMFANNGIGAVNAIDVQVSGLQMRNFLAGDINVDNTSANMSIAFINQDVAGGAVTINSSGNIDLIDNAVDSPGITSINGDVTLVAGGSILDAGVAISHVFGANAVTLNSSAGVGTFATPITIEDIGAGGLSASTSGINDIYIDHIAGSLNSDFVISAITAGSGIVQINNQNAAQDTRVSGPVSLSGATFSLVSPSSMFIDSNIVDNGAGTIDLQVTGAGGNLFINTGNIQSTAGNISLTADNDIQFTGTGNINNSPGGLTSLFATNGVLQTLATAGVVGGGDLNASAANGIDLSGNNNVGVLNLNATTGNIIFNDTNNLQLGLIAASTLNSVTLTSAGAITDNNVALNNITAQTLSINAVNGIGTLADPIELSIDNFIQFNNSTSGDVYLVNSVPNNILLNGSNGGGDVAITLDNNILLQAINAGGDISILSTNGNIQDSNGVGTVNLTAANINLTVFSDIGGGDPVNTPAPIETQISGATGLINVSTTGSAGHIEILNYAVNTTDVVSMTSSNTGINGETYLFNPGGVTEINNVTSDGFIEIKALALDLNGVVNNNDIGGVTSIFLVADEFDVTAGSINANAGFIDLITLTDGRDITLGSIDAGGTSLDLVQADIAAFNASGIKIGKNDTLLLSGSGDINVTGSLDFGAMDLKLETLNNINFQNGALAGLSTTGVMDVVANLAITSDLSTGFSLISPILTIAASNGIGSVNPVRTQTADLSVFNTNSNHVSILNSGALSLSDSASLAGDLSVVTDGILTLTPNAGLAGTTGAIANNKLTLEGTGGLIINGVASAVAIDLLSDNGIGINDTVTATGFLQIDSDVDGNAIGDLLIENISGGVLNVSAANMNIHSASAFLLATSGAVHVSSNGGLNLVAENDLTISGGDATGADAYFSSRALTNINVGGNILLSGGTAPNTAASIFDETGANTNNMVLTAGGNVTLTAGTGDNSGAFISAANLNMNVTGDLSLTGGIGNTSPAIIRSTTGVMAVHTASNLTLTDGTGLQSPARIISNAGFGFLDISFLSCVGCADGLVFLEQPIQSAANDEIVSGINVLGDKPLVSSSEALFDQLQQYIEDGGDKPLLGPDGEGPIRDQIAANDGENDEENQSIEGNEVKPRVMVCR